MKNITKLLFTLCAILVVQFSSSQNNGQNLEDHFVQGKIRIKIKEQYLLQDITAQIPIAQSNGVTELGVTNIDRIGDNIGITRINRVFPFSVKNEESHRKYGLHLWYEIAFDSSIDPQNVIDRYSVLAEVELAKAVYKKMRIDGDTDPKKIKVGKLKSTGQAPLNSRTNTADFTTSNTVFNDPLLANQWHYNNDGTLGTEGMDIDLEKAWTKSTGSSNVIVAIVDGGIDVNHEDLNANIWVNEAELNGEDGVDDDMNGYIDDFNGSNFVFTGSVTPHMHGTHVAGTVGAVSNNGIGVAGVAGGDGNGNGVRLMSCQVFDDRSSVSGNFAAAIVYGADNGAVISQNSWGYTIPDYYEPEVLEAIRYFIAEAGQYEGSPMKGGVVFFAAGNDGLEQTHYPGSFEEVIAVTSLGPSGFPAPYTNFGPWTDIAAPGGDQSSFGEEGGVLSTLPGNSYGYFQGTSMSCPHVSGVAALVVSKFGSAEFTANELNNIIRNSTTGFIFDHQDKYGKGMLNAANALADDERIAPDKIEDLAANEILHNGVRIGWTVPADEDNFQPAYFQVAISDTEITAGNFDSKPSYLLESSFDAGTPVQVSLGGLNKQSNYWVAIKSWDMFSNISEISNIVAFTTTNEPHFMESTRSINIEMDVTESEVYTENISFSNIGEGVVYWDNYVENERYYFEEQSRLSNRISDKANNSSSQINSTQNSAAFGTFNAFDVQNFETRPDFWNYDTTVFVAGMSYENGSNPSGVLGTTTNNTGLVHATRFLVDYNYTFNLTHVEIALLPEVNEEPIIIEIKKGSTSLESAETVYLQEYYPDTTNVLKYYRVPLYKPQRFNDGETFWIVMHHPVSDNKPLAVFVGDRILNHFLMSNDNGRTFFDYQYWWDIPYIPMLRALSTGDDGSYVFLEPGSGSIDAGEANAVKVNIDGSSLTNGKHLASLAIVTNDIHKPIVNIEVKVDVKGQLPKVDQIEVHKFDVLKDKLNELQFELSNTGLADLEIYSVISSNLGIENTVQDTLLLRVDKELFVPFTYTTDTIGVFDFSVNLKTNIGEISLPVKMISEAPATIELQLAQSEIALNHGEDTNLELTITNSGSNSSLEFSLEHYNPTNVLKKKMANPLEYTIVTSNDIDGPSANQWEDISDIGFYSDGGAMWKDTLQMKMDFPFFSEMYSESWGHIIGSVFFYQGGWKAQQLPVGVFNYNNVGLSVLAPLMFENANARIEEFYHYSFGDRTVYSFKLNVNSTFSGVAIEGPIEYQIVLFRDGTIEYRYKTVNNIPNDAGFIVAIQGQTNEIFKAYRNLDEPEKTIHDGMVIRFEPQNVVPMIIDTNIEKGTLLPGESAAVNLKIDPSVFDITAGTYTDAVVVYANTEFGTEKVPFTLNILGNSSFMAIDSLNFEKLNVGFSDSKRLAVTNTGSDKGEIINVEFSNIDFTINQTLPIEVSAQSEYLLDVLFTPLSSQDYYETMTLSYSDGSQDIVILTGLGGLDPGYLIDIPSEISVNLNGGEKTTIPFSVTSTNNGVNLEYTFVNSTHVKAGHDIVKRAEGLNLEAVTQDYGYTWDVSDTLNKPFFKWEDLTGESHEVLKIEQNVQQEIVLPFSFPFYGGNYDKIWVSKNGYITVVEPTSDEFSLEFDKEDGLSGMIVPFWSSLEAPTNNDGVMMLLEDDRILLQWNEFTGTEGNLSGGSVSFQLELKNDGSIYFHYKDVEQWGGVLQYGLESPDESEVFHTVKSWIVAWSIFTDNSTVAIAPPLKEKVVSGVQENFNLEISAETIYQSGVFSDTISFKTNSLAQPELYVPVTLNVIGAPIISGPEQLHWEKVVYSDNTMLSKIIKIKNIGHELLTVSRVTIENLDGLELYDKISGEEIVKNSAGTLADAFEIMPWEDFELRIEIPVNNQADVNGSVRFFSNALNLDTAITAEIVDSPVFEWDAVDQNYLLKNDETKTYTFNLENTGETTLKFNLVPAVIPSNPPSGGPVIIDEPGNYSFNEPRIVDSLAVDTKLVGDGVFTPLVGGTVLAFSDKYKAPEGGFFLTHVKTYTHLAKIGEYVRIMVYLGGENPGEGTKVYQEDYIIDNPVDKQWINFPLKVPVSFEEGQEFHIVYLPPVDRQFVGFDITNDPKILTETHVGVYWADGVFNWYNMINEPVKMVWKIRALTAAGEGQWVQLDHLEGELQGGESIDVTATVDAALAGPGDHRARILATTNDVNHSKDEFKIDLNINGKPVIEYRPNQTSDTLKVRELEELTVNYKVSDPEGDVLEFEFIHLENEPNVSFSQIDNEFAQFKIETDYESAGVYKWIVKLKDAVGNITEDEILVEVLDKNRPPVLNPEFATIELNIADPNAVFTIDASILFTDPDGDELQILAGNYTPEIVDLALGFNYIDIHPLKEGTGFLVFAADDGKEDGFVIYGVYVIIINDPDSVDGSPDGLPIGGISEDDLELDAIVVNPNPVTGGVVNIYFKLVDNAPVTIEVFDMTGRLSAIETFNSKGGINSKIMNFPELSTGVYMLRYSVNDAHITTKKLIIN